MIIRNENELELFESILRQCRGPVLLKASNGILYDLRKPMERCLGISEMLRSRGKDEPEIFASLQVDEMRFIRFMYAQSAEMTCQLSGKAI